MATRSYDILRIRPACCPAFKYDIRLETQDIKSSSPSWGEGEDSQGLDEFVRNKLGQDERELKFRRPRVAFIYSYSVNYDRLSNYGPFSAPCNACLTRSIAPVYSHSILIQPVYIIRISV